MIITVNPVRRVKKQIRSTNCGENPGEASAFFGICALPGAPVASIRPASALSLMALWSGGAAWSQGLAGQGSSALQLILGANKGTLGIALPFLWGLAHSHRNRFASDLCKGLPIGEICLIPNLTYCFCNGMLTVNCSGHMGL